MAGRGAQRVGRRKPSFTISKVVLAVAVMLASASFTLPSTRKGVQCPTAPVQKITVQSVRELADGETVHASMTRAPEPGEPGFVQCRCAEKKAAEKHVVVAGDLKELPAILVDAPLDLYTPTVRVREGIEGPPQVAICATTDPPVRPPNLA